MRGGYLSATWKTITALKQICLLLSVAVDVVTSTYTPGIYCHCETGPIHINENIHIWFPKLT